MGGEGAQRSSDLLELGAVPGVTGRETDSKAEHGVIGSAEPEFGTGSEAGPRIMGLCDMATVQGGRRADSRQLARFVVQVNCQSDGWGRRKKGIMISTTQQEVVVLGLFLRFFF